MEVSFGQHSDGPTSSVGITPRALKLKDACKYIGGVSEITLRRLIDRGVIKPNRSLRHLLIPVAELDRFLNQWPTPQLAVVQAVAKETSPSPRLTINYPNPADTE